MLICSLISTCSNRGKLFLALVLLTYLKDKCSLTSMAHTIGIYYVSELSVTVNIKRKEQKGDNIGIVGGI
jgi:hypothetical protein